MTSRRVRRRSPSDAAPKCCSPKSSVSEVCGAVMKSRARRRGNHNGRLSAIITLEQRPRRCGVRRSRFPTRKRTCHRSRSPPIPSIRRSIGRFFTPMAIFTIPAKTSPIADAALGLATTTEKNRRNLRNYVPRSPRLFQTFPKLFDLPLLRNGLPCFVTVRTDSITSTVVELLPRIAYRARPLGCP